MSHRLGKELYDAIELNDINKVNQLLKEDVYMYYENPRNGKITGMEFACNAGYIEIIKLLIKKGYNINRVNKEGATALFYALFSENEKCFEYLVLNNADVNIRDSNGMTVLHLAILHAKYKHIMTLLNNNANINIPFTNANLHTLLLCMHTGNYLKILPVFMVSNYWVFNNIRLVSSNDINILRMRTLLHINHIHQILENVKNNIIKWKKQIDSKITFKKQSINIFQIIKLTELNKESYINNIYNFNTYQQTILYNLSMIHVLERAISEAYEYMIIGCKETLSLKKRSKERRLKEYVTIRYIAKVVELKEKLKYYETQYNRTLNIMNNKIIELSNIGNIVNTRCDQMIQQI